jgi:hypothetical protein
METPQFKEMVQKSLDKDLSDLLYNGRVSARDAMDLQMLRIARGRAFFMNTTSTGVEGWSADGVKWYPQEPGNETK